MNDLLEKPESATPESATPAPAPQSRPMEGMKKKILLADDDAGVRQILERLLQEEGYMVLTAANGEETLTRIGAAKFDLVILDLNMRVQDGRKTFEQLSTENPLLPIILITAEPTQNFTALASGVAALVQKPFDFVQLFATIHTLLSEPERTRLAQMSGRASEFRFIPAKPGETDGKAQS